MADEQTHNTQEQPEPQEQETTTQVETTPEGNEAKSEVDTTADELRKQLARMEQENRKLKDENGARRVKAKEAEQQAETLRKVAQALGLEPTDDDPEQQIKRAQETAKEREAERDRLQAELDQLRADGELRKLAKENGADPDLLVPYLRGTGQLPEWGNDEWGGKAAELVKTTLNSFPQFKAGGAPRTSGTPAPTNNDDGKPLSADDLNRLYKQGKYAEINKAVREGRVG